MTLGVGMLGLARYSKIKAGCAGLSLLLLSGVAHAEIEINPHGWKFPNLLTSAKEMIRVSDRTPLIEGKETLLKGYRKMDGTHFMTFEIEGRVFGVLVDADGKPPFEYSIMDTDGDGKFESKFSSGPNSKESGYVPQWIIDFYYSKHPELKNPSGGAKGAAPPALKSATRPDATPTPPPQVVKPPKEVLSQPNP